MMARLSPIPALPEPVEGLPFPFHRRLWIEGQAFDKLRLDGFLVHGLGW
jgi:hypothetical protein